MITDQEIKNLIKCPKQIYKRDPRSRYKEEGSHKKGNLLLNSEEHHKDLPKVLEILDKEDSKKRLVSKKIQFQVFIRQNQSFLENFSIGLIYNILKFPNGLNLIRYKGPHESDSTIVHHLKPHIHKMTTQDMNSLNPKPSQIEITDKYNTLEEGLLDFFEYTNIKNWKEYFPEWFDPLKVDMCDQLEDTGFVSI